MRFCERRPTTVQASGLQSAARAPQLLPVRPPLPLRSNKARGQFRAPQRIVAEKKERASDKPPVNKSPFDKGFKWGWKKPAGTGQSAPPKDVYWELRVELAEAVLGAEKELQFRRQARCEKCRGGGLVPSTTLRCTPCSGKGLLAQDKTVSVKVPAGVQDGAQLRLREQGEWGAVEGESSGGYGDLLVRITVPASSGEVRRDGKDLYSYAYVQPADLRDGGSVLVKTIEGTEGSLKVPAGTKEGAYLRIPGRGAPKKLGALEDRGDHFFQLVVKST